MAIHADASLTRAQSVDAVRDKRIFAAGGPNLLKERNMFDLGDTVPLAEFQQNAREHLQRLQQSGRPQVLTVENGPDAVVQSATAYRALLERLERAETVIGMQRGIKAALRGESVELDEAFEQIRNGTWRGT